jgi:hypothetical protein
MPPESFEPFESFTVPEAATGSAARLSDPLPAVVGAPTVSDERRARGMAIAVALLAVLVAGIAWYVWDTAREVVPPRARDTVAPAGPATSPTTPPASPRS